jgi:hypothetical protein
VQPGGAGHRGANTVALRTAVAKDLPGLHPREDVLGAGPAPAAGEVVLLPGRQFGPAAFAAARDDQAGAPVAAVRDDRGPADGGGLRTGQFPRLAVVAVPISSGS